MSSTLITSKTTDEVITHNRYSLIGIDIDDETSSQLLEMARLHCKLVLATRSAVAGASHALTFEKLASMVSDARSILISLCESQLDPKNLEVECNRLLERSKLRSDRIIENYLVPFDVQD